MRHSVTCYQVSREVQISSFKTVGGHCVLWSGSLEWCIFSPAVPFVKETTGILMQPGNQTILLMDEILHHLGCMKPCKEWDKLPTNWCRISSINSTSQFLWFLFSTLGVHHSHPLPIRFAAAFYPRSETGLPYCHVIRRFYLQSTVGPEL